MAAQERALFEPISVPSWFSMDVRLGQPCITLEPPGCFFAEEYALALGVPDVAEDVKVNYGKLVLDGECWVFVVVFWGCLLVVLMRYNVSRSVWQTSAGESVNRWAVCKVRHLGACGGCPMKRTIRPVT